MPFTDAEFDAITIGFGFRNLTFGNANSDKHLSEISRILKHGGKLCILESAVPRSSFIRFFYKLYLRMILIPLGGLLSGDWKAYRYLALSSANFYSEDEIRALLDENDLQVKRIRRFFMGAANLIVAVKRQK
jgi:demethylmenaquinone methyltransferase/2-methoxy-6-polyprenyl-1,4-benzoquinol methylase